MSNKIDNSLLDFMNSVSKTSTMPSEIKATSLEHKEMVVPEKNNSSRLVEGEVILASESELEQIIDTSRKNSSTVVDKILKSQRMSDMAGIGDSMNDLITTAKGLDPDRIKNKGLFGKLKSMLGNAKEQFERETDSVLERIETLSKEMNKNIQTQMNVKNDFMILQKENEQIIFQYGKDITKFQAELQKVAQYRNSRTLDDVTLLKLKNYEDRLNFFLENLQNDKVASEINSKEIENSLNSVVKIIDAIKSNESNLINDWKMTLSTYLRNQAQQSGIDLSNKMREAREESLRKRGELSNSVTIGAATLQNTTNTSLQTLSDLTTKLEDTQNKVKEIEEAGKLRRKEDQQKREEVENRIRNLNKVN